ncbi:MAG: PQQ-binding-like beta-propeller repeat protein [Armatimonadetes bacterium]|nr:PQQ-binding-like beta-propeller repeat protein [Armatimonadota bacterium]
MPSSLSNSARRAERNVRLDPLGIYGTRSARRRNQLQRRRRVQNLFLWLLGLAAVALLVWWIFQPHTTSLRASWTRELRFRPATAPVAASNGNLLFTSQSGGLWLASPLAESWAPRRLFATAFAPGAPPLFAANRVFWAGGDGIVAALDFPSGAVKWQRALPSTLVARPAHLRAVGRAIVAVGDDEGHVAAFDAISGAPLWKKGLGGVTGEAIVALQGTPPSFLVPLGAGATSRGGLVCLDGASGALRWRFPSDGRSPGGGLAAPAVAGDRVYWCNDEGAVVALEAQSGRKIWKTFAAPRSEPRRDKTANASMVMLRGAPVVAPDAGVVVVGGNDGLLRAFDGKNGAARWSLELGGVARFAAQLVDFEGGKALLAGGDAPTIFLLDPRDGRVLRRWTTPFNADFGVMAMDGMAFALDSQGHLQGAPLR